MPHPNRFYFVTTVLLAAIATSGCANRVKPAANTKPPEVLVGEPITREVRDYEYFTGRTESSSRVDIRARVTGYLEKDYFTEGAMVKQGDILFRIDPRPYQAELDRAKADLARAQAHLFRVEADLQRADTLLRNRAISREEYDRMFGDRDEAKAEVGVEASSVRLAELQLEFTEVKAPFDGRIGRSLVDPGNLVKADETQLTTLVALEPMFVYFDVDERTFLRKMLQQNSREDARAGKIAIQVGLVDEEGYPHAGTVNFMDNVVDSGTGTIWMRGVFRDPDRPITPGLFSRVRFPIGDPYSALLVAEQALGTDQGQRFLFVVDEENVVRYRPVRVGPLNNGMRVIREGLKPGEKVIVSGLQRIRAGSPITPKLIDMQGLASKKEDSLLPSTPKATAEAPAQHNLKAAPAAKEGESEPKPASTSDPKSAARAARAAPPKSALTPTSSTLNSPASQTSDREPAAPDGPQATAE